MFDAKQMEWFNQLSAEDLAILGAGFNTLGDFLIFWRWLRPNRKQRKEIKSKYTKQQLFHNKFHTSSILILI